MAFQSTATIFDYNCSSVSVTCYITLINTKMVFLMVYIFWSLVGNIMQLWKSQVFKALSRFLYGNDVNGGLVTCAEHLMRAWKNRW